MKQWFYILLLSIAFVANSSTAMVMPVFMLSTTPVSDDASASVATPSMPCHQVVPATTPEKTASSKPTKQHCPNCEKMEHVAIGDGCGSCSCFGVNGVISPVVGLTPLTLPSPEYTDNYRIHSSSVFPLPLLRPPKHL